MLFDFQAEGSRETQAMYYFFFIPGKQKQFLGYMATESYKWSGLRVTCWKWWVKLKYWLKKLNVAEENPNPKVRK